jgi:hypothetical protein
MEVHHHPDVEKKSFKQYLLEGLMIFVAVTMGFFAESLRENINAGEKEKEFIVSFENNLRSDKLSLEESISANQQKIKDLDSLLAFSDQDLKDVKNREALYTYARNISTISVFISHDATMSQLKNSGGLQYIKRAHLADSIAKYDQEVRGIYAAEGAYEKYANEATLAMTEIFVFNLKGASEKSLPLLTSDPIRLQVFFNKIKLERGWTQNYIKNLQQRLPFTTKLIGQLKKEYDLDD